MSAWIQRGTVAAGFIVAWFWATVLIAGLAHMHPSESWAPTFWTSFATVAPWTGSIIGSIVSFIFLGTLHDAAPRIAEQIAQRKLAQREALERQQAETNRVLKDEGIDL